MFPSNLIGASEKAGVIFFCLGSTILFYYYCVSKAGSSSCCWCMSMCVCVDENCHFSVCGSSQELELLLLLEALARKNLVPPSRKKYRVSWKIIITTDDAVYMQSCQASSSKIAHKKTNLLTGDKQVGKQATDFFPRVFLNGI